jgi:GDP-L-fucose synthase
MNRVLITGGRGFIAQSLLESLDNSYDIICAGRNELDLLDSEKVYNFIKNGQFDVVIHTANYDAAPSFTTKDKSKVLEQNLTMFFNLARCSDFFGKMLYFGSGAEFSRPHWVPMMSEDYFDTYVPADQYGLSKYIMTKYTEKSKNIYNLRLFAITGETDDWRYRFVSLACCKAVFGIPITFRQNVFFDFLYIKDLINIIKWFIVNKPKHQVYNVCRGKVDDYQSIAEKICQFAGKNLEIRSEVPGLMSEYSGDNSRLLEELTDYKFVPMEESIQEMLLYLQQNKDSITPETFAY